MTKLFLSIMIWKMTNEMTTSLYVYNSKLISIFFPKKKIFTTFRITNRTNDSGRQRRIFTKIFEEPK